MMHKTLNVLGAGFKKICSFPAFYLSQLLLERKLPISVQNCILKHFTSPPCFNSQVVSTSRLAGTDLPLEIVYFVEGPSGQRMPADQTASLLNSLDVQRAAIVLGYRVQGILAQRKYVSINR